MVREKGELDMLEKMKTIIAEQLSVDADSIQADSNFKEDLGADSLDLFELVMELKLAKKRILRNSRLCLKQLKKNEL